MWYRCTLVFNGSGTWIISYLLAAIPTVRTHLGSTWIGTIGLNFLHHKIQWLLRLPWNQLQKPHWNTQFLRILTLKLPIIHWTSTQSVSIALSLATGLPPVLIRAGSLLSVEEWSSLLNRQLCVLCSLGSTVNHGFFCDHHNCMHLSFDF